MDFMQIILNWPTILMECATSGTKMFEDIIQLNEWATLFSDAEQAAKIISTRVVFNIDDIIEKVEGIDELSDSGQFYMAG